MAFKGSTPDPTASVPPIRPPRCRSFAPVCALVPFGPGNENRPSDGNRGCRINWYRFRRKLLVPFGRKLTLVVFPQISVARHRLVHQPSDLNLQASLLLDEILSMSRECLQRHVNFADRSRCKAVSVDRCMNDRLQVVVVGLGVRVQRFAESTATMRKCCGSQAWTRSWICPVGLPIKCVVTLLTRRDFDLVAIRVSPEESGANTSNEALEWSF